MNCYNHPNKPAVVQCRQCGKGFCEDCSHDVVDGLCSSCRAVNQQAITAQINAKSKEEQKWHRTGLLWIIGGLSADLLFILTNMKEYIWMGIAVGFFVFYFRYARRLVHALLSRLAPKGGGCLVNPIIVLILDFFAFIPIGFVSPLLLVYSIARALGMKKGIIDYIPWF